MSQLITCPECSKHLQVPDELLGKTVQCPECKHTFTARESTPTEVVTATSTTVAKPSKPSAPPSLPAKQKAEWDRDADEEEEDTRSRKSKPPSKKRRDDDDDDDDDEYEDRVRRRRRSSYSNRYVPHRGGAILAFGIISLVSHFIFPLLALIFGPIAWFMGNADMAEIRAGRMDPTGEGMVQTGRILGIIATIIAILGVLAACLFVGFIVLVALMAGRHRG